MEMVEDHRRLFHEIASVVVPGGHLVVVMNHPVSTAPTSEPLVDLTGEILWRWGDYLSPGHLVQIVEQPQVVLVHRPMGDLLGAAADAGWRLDRLAERAAVFPTIGEAEITQRGPQATRYNRFGSSATRIRQNTSSSSDTMASIACTLGMANLVATLAKNSTSENSTARSTNCVERSA